MWLLPGLPGTFSFFLDEPALDMVLETERNVQEDPSKEAETDMDLSILESVKPLEVCWPVDGDVPVNCHADDDIDRASHERVDERYLEMCLVDGSSVASTLESLGDIKECRNSSDEDTKVGD